MNSVVPQLWFCIPVLGKMSRYVGARPNNLYIRILPKQIHTDLFMCGSTSTQCVSFQAQ